MRQAIEEGFILDVLRNYTTYSTWFKFVKTVEDDPTIPKKKGAKALAKFKELHLHNIEQKTEVVVEHFREHVRHQLGGRGKAMVVTASRIQAVRYKLAFERYIQEQGYTDIRSLVAFSGTVKDPDTGVEYTEPGMNPDAVTGKPIPESQLPERFGSSDYQVLLVANKYQTGFDQPLLCAMYVDKRLDGVQAVQTLSRLNRKIAGKDEPFVLDFVNKPEEIYAAFKPYFDSTSLQESAKPEMLPAIKHELDQFQIYHWSEVEAFARIFYRQPERQNPADHAHMQRHLQPAVDRFKAIEDESVRSACQHAGWEALWAVSCESQVSLSTFDSPKSTRVIAPASNMHLMKPAAVRALLAPVGVDLDARAGFAGHLRVPTRTYISQPALGTSQRQAMNSRRFACSDSPTSRAYLETEPSTSTR